MHKRINQLLLVLVIIFGGMYFLQSKVNTPEKCEEMGGKWNYVEESCEKAVPQVIYENLAASYPITVNYPESKHQVTLDKKETVENHYYLRGHYQEVLHEATSTQEAEYDRGSFYLNMSKMVMLTDNRQGTVYYAAPFVANTAGSGVFVYVGLFSYDLNSKQSVHHDSQLLGERVREERLSFDEKGLQVDYLTHDKSQDTAQYPTKVASQYLLVEGLRDNMEASFRLLKRMHPSWDSNNDGINDCEQQDRCDHSIDYTQPKAK